MSSKTIKTIAAAAANTLRERAPKARSRTLDADDIEHAVRTHLRLSRKAPEGSVVRTTLTGGFVPNSYKYRADCDHVTIEGRKAASLTVLPQRAWAQKRSHGDGDTQITRYIADGQSVGTIAHKE